MASVLQRPDARVAAPLLQWEHDDVAGYGEVGYKSGRGYYALPFLSPGARKLLTGGGNAPSADVLFTGGPVAEDSALFAESLVGILESAGDIRVVGVAIDGGKAVLMTSELRPDVVFHDGTPFDAAAVQFNFERHREPEQYRMIVERKGAIPPA